MGNGARFPEPAESDRNRADFHVKSTAVDRLLLHCSFLCSNLKSISIPACFKSHFFYAGTNRCGKNNGGCAHNCVRYGSGYNCSCSTGFQLESDHHNCTGEKK